MTKHQDDPDRDSQVNTVKARKSLSLTENFVNACELAEKTGQRVRFEWNGKTIDAPGQNTADANTHIL